MYLCKHCRHVVDNTHNCSVRGAMVLENAFKSNSDFNLREREAKQRDRQRREKRLGACIGIENNCRCVWCR